MVLLDRGVFSSFQIKEMVKLSKEKHGKRIHHDIDPEDLDSNYAPSSFLTSKSKLGKEKRSREHLEDVKSLKRRVTLDDQDDEDDIDRFGEKYRGERKSRKELGFETSEEEEDFSGEGSECLSNIESDVSVDEDADDSPDSEDVEAELRRIEDEDTLHQPKIFATPRTTPAESGRALRAHYKAYSEAMETRSRLQPLLGLANKLDNQSRMGLGRRRELGMKQVLLDIIPKGADVDSLNNNISMKMIWRVMEREHSSLIREARSVLDSEYIVPAGKSKAKKMKVINQSIWSQVQLAMQDKDRLLERVGKRRIPGSERMLGVSNQQGMEGEGTQPVFDDNDFFTTQIRDWIASLGSALTLSTSSSANTTVLFNASNRKKKLVEPRSSKGRKLKYDTHTLLAGLCAPRRNGNAWEEDRVDDLCRSLLGGTIASRVRTC